MSITHRILRRFCALALSAAVAGFAFTSDPSSATAHGEDICTDPTGVVVVKGNDDLKLNVNASAGTTHFKYFDATGALTVVETDEIVFEIADPHTELPLYIRYSETSGIVENSPEGEDTTLHQADGRGRVALTLTREEDAYKEYDLMFLDDDGHELPSLPTVKVKTKPSCPASPFEDQIEAPE